MSKVDTNKQTEHRDQERLENLNRELALKMEIPRAVCTPAIYRRISLFQLIYSLAGLTLGLACVGGGIVLFLHGISGTTTWTARIVGAQSGISDAAPGTVLFVAGLLIVLLTKFTVKVK